MVRSNSHGWPRTHYSTVFDGKTPCLCGAVREPATSSWRDVSCNLCLTKGAAAGNSVAAERLKAVGDEKQSP